MKNTLVSEILKNNKSVRQIIDEAVENGDISLASADDMDEVESDSSYSNLYVRHAIEGARPKRTKVKTAAEAINLFFNWVNDSKHNSENIDIFDNNSQEVKKFYRFCANNREMIGGLWQDAYQKTQRMKRDTVKWPIAYRRVKEALKAKDETLVGELEPFVIKKK